MARFGPAKAVLHIAQERFIVLMPSQPAAYYRFTKGTVPGAHQSAGPEAFRFAKSRRRRFAISLAGSRRPQPDELFQSRRTCRFNKRHHQRNENIVLAVCT